MWHIYYTILAFNRNNR